MFEEGLRGNQVNAIEGGLSAFDLGCRLEQTQRYCGFDRPSQIDRVGTVFRRLHALKRSRNRDIRAPVENESEYTFAIVANQQDHGFSEIGVAEVPASHQQLSSRQTLGIPGLDGEKSPGRYCANALDPVRSV